MLTSLKSIVERIPEPLARPLTRVPFAWRLGPAYTRARADLLWWQNASLEARRTRTFELFHDLVANAVATNAFYRNFYAARGFELKDLRGFDDIARVPIVTKADLREYDLESRSSARPGRLRINTGGTSGQPLAFYLDRHAFAREWAHMHAIWGSLGYRPSDVKLTFRGRNLGQQVLRYNVVHNEYLVSQYAGGEKLFEAVANVAARREIRFLHGYPSAIYEFARNVDSSAPHIRDALRRTLKGILFGSEFPAPAYRELIEKVFPVPNVSWYGHSEMAILASERGSQFAYHPFHSYGFTEAVPTDDGHRLIGTSFYNRASHFIRYDTGDVVQPELEGGFVREFRVTSGRIGDFIMDRNGHRVGLTALVFGRHHKLFEKAHFVQVSQDRPGQATLLVTMDAHEVRNEEDWLRLFDSSNVAIDFRFELRSEPIRTPSGKVPLLVEAPSSASDA